MTLQALVYDIMVSNSDLRSLQLTGTGEIDEGTVQTTNRPCHRSPRQSSLVSRIGPWNTNDTQASATMIASCYDLNFCVEPSSLYVREFSLIVLSITMKNLTIGIGQSGVLPSLTPFAASRIIASDDKLYVASNGLIQCLSSNLKVFMIRACAPRN